MPRLILPLLLLSLAFLLAGCGGPNKANIELRKQRQQLRSEVAELQQENQQLRQTIASYEQSRGTIETLPEARLNNLFTVAGVEFGRLTGPADLDPAIDGYEGFKVYLKPIDENGATLKAAGEIVVEAFDLNAPDTRLGRWQFPFEGIKQYWYGGGLLNEYVLPCQWQQAPPAGQQITIRVRFTEALTGRTFEAKRDLQVPPPQDIATTQPAE